MQILIQRFLKTTKETTSNPSINKKESVKNQKVKSKDIVLFGICRGTKRSDKSRSKSKTFSLFNILCRRDITKEYFYSTIHLRRVGSNNRRQKFVHNCMKMKKESLTRGLSISHKANSETAIVTASHVGHTQVLPVTDSAPSSTTNDKERCSSGEKKEKSKADKAKTISKMKELLRWAAAAKAQKGNNYISRKVFQFRNRGALKAVPDDDQLSNDSPKISFRWDVESCSTISSTYSALSMPTISTKNINDQIKINFTSVNSTPIHIDQCPAAAAAKLNWITTDSEFVVLEL